MMICYACGQDLDLPEEIHRQDICPRCRADLHCCLNCRHYDSHAHNQCREPSAEWVSAREKNNFCEFFRLAEGGSATSPFRAQQEARAKLEALFKK